MKKLEWIRLQPCVMPHKQKHRTEAAHIRTAENSGTGCKPDDKYTLSFCAKCHKIQHQHGHQELLETMLGGEWDKYTAKQYLLDLSVRYDNMYLMQREVL